MLKNIKGINNFFSKKVTNICRMFNLCSELEFLDLSNFNTSNVIDMELLFNKCHKLKKLKGSINLILLMSPICLVCLTNVEN